VRAGRRRERDQRGRTTGKGRDTHWKKKELTAIIEEK